MKIIINKKDITMAIKKVSVCLDAKSKTQLLKNIELETILPNKVKFTTTDILNKVEIITFCEVVEEGKIILNDIKNLEKSIKYLNGYIEINDIDSRSVITIKDVKKTIMQTLNNDFYADYIEINEVENATITTIYDNIKFLERINLVKYAMSTDISRPQLSSLHFNKSDIVAIDGYRLSVSTDQSLLFNDSFTLPAKSVKILISLLDKKNNYTIKVSQTDKIIKFEWDNIVLTSLLYDGSYLKYEGIIGKGSQSCFLTNDIIDELKETIAFLNSGKEAIKISMNKEEIILKYGNKSSEISIITNCKEPFNFGINGYYLLDILKNIKESELFYENAMSPFTLVTNSYTNLILPVKIK